MTDPIDLSALIAQAKPYLDAIVVEADGFPQSFSAAELRALLFDAYREGLAASRSPSSAQGWEPRTVVRCPHDQQQCEFKQGGAGGCLDAKSFNYDSRCVELNGSFPPAPDAGRPPQETK